VIKAAPKKKGTAMDTRGLKQNHTIQIQQTKKYALICNSPTHSIQHLDFNSQPR
jgi:hypothetical protein